MSTIIHIWPRQEVLQLVLPQFSHSNRAPLVAATVFDALKHLAQAKTPDGRVSFDRWLITAKSVLKWQDAFIKL